MKSSPYIRPIKKLGQNFLKDKNIALKIVDSLRLEKPDLMLEIGPGPGVLTELLAGRADMLAAVELDSRLASVLQNHFEKHENVDIVNEDFLKFDLHQYLLRFPGRHRGVIGNIPYNITSPVLFKVLDEFQVIEQVVFMVQKEVAERIAAPPGNKSYGILSVLCQFYAGVEYLFTVPARLFRPQPKVDSAVIRLSLQPEAEKRVADPVLFRKIVRSTFGQRRKMLRNTLSNLFPGIKLDTLSIDLTRRPETLSVEEFVGLANQICHQETGKNK